MHELKSDYTIVIVTHNMQQAARISDKTAFFLSACWWNTATRTNCSPIRSGRRRRTTSPADSDEKGEASQVIRQFEQSLQDVKDLLLQMGEKVEIAIDKAVKSLVNLDEKMAREVLDSDSEMDELENQIDDRVAKLIVTQQPVAKDLRRLIAAKKIATDMERMADYACNIARVTLRLVESGQPLFKSWRTSPDGADHPADGARRNQQLHRRKRGAVQAIGPAG